MAITHSIKFTANAKDAISEIEKYGDKIVATAQTVDKYANALGGSKILAQANNWVAAVDKIGGATKLTGAEQEKVNRILDQAIQKYTALGKTAPTAMTDLYNATKKLPPATESWADSVTKSAAGYLAGMATFETVKRIIGGTVAFLQESVTAAAEAQAAMSRLETAMRTSGVATEGNRQAFKALADEMQRTTVYEDDQIVALEAMATQLGVLPSQMEGAVKAAANLASGLGVDLETAMRMIVKANNESYTAFSKLGIAIDETRAKAEGLPYILEQINAGLGGQAAAEVETYAGQLKQLANEWGNLKEQIGNLVVANGLLADSLGTVTEMLRGANAATATWGNTISVVAAMALRGGLPSVVEELLRLGKVPPPTLDPKGVSDGAMAMRKALDGVNESLDTLLKKAKDQAAKDLEMAGRSAKQAAEQFKSVTAAVREIELGGRGGAGAIWEFGRRLDEAGDTAAAVKGFEEVRAKLYEIEKIGAGAGFEVWKVGRLIDEAGETKQAVSDMEQASEEAAKKSAKGWKIAADVFGEVSRAAEMAGHSTTAAVMSIGAAVASAAPGGPWAMAAAGAMAVFSTVAGTLFKTEGRKVNDLRDAFIGAAGGLDALNRKAVAAGTTLNALLQAKTVKEYEAAVASLNANLEKTAQLQGELAGLQATLAGRQVMDWKKAEELIVKYGGTLGNLGQQFTAAKQAASWAEVWDDWQTLIDMGGDVGGVLVSMKDEIGTLVSESQRIGTEIPEQFKPLIEELIRTGQLFGSTGEQITDIGQLKFGAPLVSEVDKIIAKIDELIEALTGHLIPAIGSIPASVRVNVGYDYEAYQPPEEGGFTGAGYTRGTQGRYLDFGAGTPVWLHGRERVMTEAEGRATSTGGGGTAVIMLDGRRLAELLVPHLPGVVQQYALG